MERDQLTAELEQCRSAFSSPGVEEALQPRFEEYIRRGYTFDQVNAAYGVSKALGCGMEELMPDAPGQEGETRGDTPPLRQEVLEAYRREQGLTQEELAKRIAEGVGQGLQAPAGAAAFAVAVEEDPDKNYLDAPFHYNHGDREHVALNSGALSYTETDLHLPGKNGLDLVIVRRYDSSMANQEEFTTRVSGGKLYTSTKDRNTYGDPFLGYGWSLGLPMVEYNASKRPLYLHMGDGRVFKLAKSLSVSTLDTNLDGYKLKDLRFYPERGTLSIHGKSAPYTHVLAYKNGRRDYFNEQNLCARTDRFGNAIWFGFGAGLSVIDTYGRSLRLSESITRCQWTGLPGDKTITYTLSGDKLQSCTDQEGRKTTYGYTDMKVSARLYSSSHDTEQKVTYTALTSVTHPTGAETEYTYNRPMVYLSSASDAYQEWLVLGSRGDNEVMLPGMYSRNVVRYHYSPGTNYITQTTVSKADEDKGITISSTVHRFDSKSKRTRETVTSGGETVSDKTIGYNAQLLPQSESWTIPYAKSVFRKYDSGLMGDVVETKDELGNITYYQYHQTYHYPIRKEYKQNASTTIVEEYTPRADGKAVEWEWITVNGVARKLTQYFYAGNEVRQKRRYYGDLDARNRYLYTEYTYGNYSPQPTVVQGGRVSHSDSPYAASPVEERHTFDWYGRETWKKDANGGETSIAYDHVGRVTKETYPDKKTKAYAYTVTTNANRIVETDENGNRTRWEYTPLGKVRGEYDDKTGVQLTGFGYDSLLRLGSKARYDGAGDNFWKCQTRYEYDYLDRVTSKIVRKDVYNDVVLGRETTVYNDAARTETRTVAGDGHAEAITRVVTRDVLGRVVSEVCGDSRMTYGYDFLGNKTSETDQFGNVTSWSYRFDGQESRRTNALNQYTEAYYDELGNPTQTWDHARMSTKYTYDALGRVLRKVATFDDGTTAETSYTYDGMGNVLTERVMNGAAGSSGYRETGYRYDSRGRLEYTIQNDGGTERRTRNVYDGVGNKTEMYTGMVGTSLTGAAKTSYTYGRFGNVLTVTDPMGRVERYTYDATGLLLSKTDRNGTVTTYTYDALDRVTHEEARRAGAAEADYRAYTYTLTGQVATESSGKITGNKFAAHFTVDRYYDNKGLPKREEEIGGVVKSHTYDGNGNRTGFQLKRNNVVEISLGYAYDKLNRMEKVTRNGAALASYTYTPNGSRASLTYTGSGTSMVTTYGYNYANLVTSLVNKRGSSTLSSFSYAYYRDGNRRSKTETVGGKAARTTSYAYDNLGRLTGEEQAGQYKHAYTYDRYSNRATLTATETGKTQGVTSYAYDQRNRLLTETKEQGGETEIYRYAYDYNGNLRRRDWERFRTAQASKKGSVKLDRGTNGGIVFREQREYDGFDQLVKLTRDGNATTYLYRTDGLRHSKSGDGGTVHIWDGQNLVTDYRGNGVIKARYLRGLGLIAQQIDGNLYFYCFNGHGDVVQRTDAAGGVLNSYEYDAFGNEREPDTVNVNPFRYCGEYWDGESETYYLRARYYDPRTARMLSEDLIRAIYHEMQNGQTLLDPLSLNLYTYCKNNPLKYKDSTGLTPTESEIIEFFYNEYFANYFDTIERFYESFQHDINKFFDAISFDVSGGYYSGDPSAYGQSLYYEAKGLNFRNGINIINAEAGISKIGGDYELLGWNLNSLVGDLALGVGTEFSGFKVGARLFGAGGEVKVSLPFTEKKLIIGVEGELFAVGFNSYYDSTANKFKIGGSLLVGGNLVFGLN